jgi:hypothetical protein
MKSNDRLWTLILGPSSEKRVTQTSLERSLESPARRPFRIF